MKISIVVLPSFEWKIFKSRVINLKVHVSFYYDKILENEKFLFYTFYKNKRFLFIDL